MSCGFYSDESPNLVDLVLVFMFLFCAFVITGMKLLVKLCWMSLLTLYCSVSFTVNQISTYFVYVICGAVHTYITYLFVEWSLFSGLCNISNIICKFYTSSCEALALFLDSWLYNFFCFKNSCSDWIN